ALARQGGRGRGRRRGGLRRGDRHAGGARLDDPRGRPRHRDPAGARAARGRPDGLRRRLPRGPPRRPRARLLLRDGRPHGEPARQPPGRGRRAAVARTRPRGVRRALRARVRAPARMSAGRREPSWRTVGLFALAGLLPAPWIASHEVRGLGFEPETVSALAGLAIIGGAFVLSWATELAERDIPQALAILFLALVSVLPEYA